MIDWTKRMPKMLAGEQLRKALTELPIYNTDATKMDEATRLMELSNLYKIYYPTAMSMEIYSKLYLAMMMSLNKKDTRLAMQQQKKNFIGMQTKEYRGIIGGSDSFSIIGTSGIGKSSAIERAVTLITEDKVISIDKPYVKIIPIIQVQCPFDASPKALLLEILRAVDMYLDSNYYRSGTRAGVTTDTLVGLVSQVCLNHIGVLIIDEIQNIVKHKKGMSLIGVLMQLINSSGISICMVGVPESIQFFETEMQLARRTLGLKYSVLPFDDYFRDFCKLLFFYQYTKKQTELSESIIRWLYEHSGGVISVVVGLIHDSQEIAILTGKEVLNLTTLNEAYEKRMSMLHSRIEPQIKHESQTTKASGKSGRRKESVKSITAIKEQVSEDTNPKIIVFGNHYVSIADMVGQARNDNLDAVELLGNHILVEEVVV